MGRPATCPPHIPAAHALRRPGRLFPAIKRRRYRCPVTDPLSFLIPRQALRLVPGKDGAMARIAGFFRAAPAPEPVIDDRAWGDVLQANRTAPYAELVDYPGTLDGAERPNWPDPSAEFAENQYFKIHIININIWPSTTRPSISDYWVRAGSGRARYGRLPACPSARRWGGRGPAARGADRADFVCPRRP